MSIQAVGWVLDHSHAEGTDRLVLIALANHANADTGECNPGQRRIAREARVSQSSVVRALDRLAAIGEVEVVARGRGHGTTRYVLPWIIRPTIAATLAARSDSPGRFTTGEENGTTSGPSESPGRFTSPGPSDSRAPRSDSPPPPSESPMGGAKPLNQQNHARARAREATVGPAQVTRTAADIEREQAGWKRADPEVAAAALADARAVFAPPPRDPEPEPDTDPEGEP